MIPSYEFSNVIICDDHYVTALGVETLLRSYSPTALQVRTASTGKMALDFFSKNEPDLVVIDLGLPDMPGLDVIKKIRAESPQARVIVLTGQNEAHLLQQAHQLKVNGLLRKSNSGKNLYEALHFMKANRDKTYLDPSVERILRTATEQDIAPRELEVLELMAEGYTSSEIAEKMKCAVTTVKTYRARIMNKSETRNSAEMMAWYLKRKGKRDFGSST